MNNTKVKFVYIISDTHKGDIYLKEIMNLGPQVYEFCVFNSEFTADRVYQLLQHPRSRPEVKTYFEINNKAGANAEANIQSAITKIIIALQQEQDISDCMSLFEYFMNQYTHDQKIEIISCFPNELIERLINAPIIKAYLESKNKNKRIQVDNPKTEQQVIIREQTLVNEGKTITEYVPVVHKQKLLPIFYAEFACELAYTLATRTKTRVCIIDMDFQNPSIDAYFGINTRPISLKYFSGKGEKSSLQLILNRAKENSLGKEYFEECSIIKQEIENLYIIANEVIYQEDYKKEDIQNVLEIALELFDYTVVICDRNVNNEATKAILECKRTREFIIPIVADGISVRNTKSYIKYISTNYDIQKNNISFVSYDSDDCCLKSLEVSKVLQVKCLGTINFSERRKKYRNLKSCYYKSMSIKIIKEYENILINLNIFPQKLLLQKLQEVILDIKNALLSRLFRFKKKNKFKKKKMFTDSFFNEYK